MERVVVYPLSSEETELARGVLEGAHGEEGVVTGLASPETIEKLSGEGVFFEVLAETRRSPGGGRGPAAPMSTKGGPPGGTVLPGHGAPRQFHENTPHPYLLQLDGPLMPESASVLAEMGVEPGEYVPDFGYVVRIGLPQLEGLRALEFVESVEEMPVVGIGFTAPSGGAEPKDLGMAAPGMAGEIYDIRLFSADQREQVAGTLAELNIPVVQQAGRKIRVRIADEAAMNALSVLPELESIELQVPPQLFNDRALALIGVADADGACPAVLDGLDGRGQIIGIADTGLDSRHEDFDGRIVHRGTLDGHGSADDTHGHGTHVAGSAAGDGRRSNGRFRGVANGSQIYFQALMDEGNLRLPLSLDALLAPAYAAGVRVHNNSWGSATASFYAHRSEEVDAFVAGHPDMVVVIAAGNEGTVNDPDTADVGRFAPYKIASPATAKNAITVGASQSDRQQGGYAERTHRDVWASRFPKGTMADIRISGQPDKVSGLSSRGPSDKGRIKPDMVAPGTDIISTRSYYGKDRNFWALHDDDYAYMGGTSMAAPLVAGSAALMRQYLIEKRGAEPSAALVKAALINGTSRMEPDPDDGGFPDYQQGFGRLNLAGSLPGGEGQRLAFADSWQTEGMALAATGKFQRFLLQTGQSGPLRICLAWTDLPGTAVQQQLALALTTPRGNRHAGNAGFSDMDRPFDRTNNVQIIRLDAAESGTYTVQVTALNLRRPQQEFALVVLGALGSDTLMRM